jgi:flagellar biogenesis protein FliO
MACSARRLFQKPTSKRKGLSDVVKTLQGFMPQTLLQWVQVASLIIGIAIVFGSFFDKLDNSLSDLDKRVTRLEYINGVSGNAR